MVNEKIIYRLLISMLMNYAMQEKRVQKLDFLLCIYIYLLFLKMRGDVGWWHEIRYSKKPNKYYFSFIPQM